MNRNLWVLAGVLAFAAVAACDALPPAPVEYHVPSQSTEAFVQAMTPGPDGNIWFTYATEGTPGLADGRVGAIASISTSGAIHEYLDQNVNAPVGIAPGFDGALWFTDGLEIGRITTAGQVTRFALPGTAAMRICEGLDRKLWFTETGDRIGSIDLAGNVSEYQLPSAGAGLTGIAAGPGGNWFVENALNRIGRISLGTGTIAEFDIPTPQSGAQAIVAGPDGNLWFTESSAGKIGRISPAGDITEFALQPGSHPFGIVAGPDDNVWYADTSGKLGRITPAGRVVEYPFKQDAGILWLSFGADGNLWFTATGKIGVLVP